MLILFLFIILMLSGCAKTWSHNDPRANWQNDSFQCENYARGVTPMPQYQQLPPTQTVTGYGTLATNTGLVPYSYSATVAPSAAAQFNTSMANAGASLGYIMALESRYEECLRHLGWYEANKNTKPSDPKELDRLSETGDRIGNNIFVSTPKVVNKN